MSRKLILAVFVAGVLLVGGLLSIQAGRAQAPGPQVLPTPFLNRSLVDASEAEVAEYVLAGVRANLDIVSGSPEVVLVRRVTGPDLDSLGLPGGGLATSERPMMLVIVRGDFDVRRYFHGFGASDPNSLGWRVQYMGFVMDLRAGMPAMSIRSARGEVFRVALNDPSLPDDHPGRGPSSIGTPPPGRTPPRQPTTFPSDFRPAAGTPTPPATPTPVR